MNDGSDINQQLNVIISKDLHRRLKAMAAERGMKLVDVAPEAFEQWLRKDDIANPPPGIDPEILKAFARFLCKPRSASDEQHVAYIMMVLKERYGLPQTVTAPIQKHT
jgi:hypothetical protein